jgi:hypothetical protein
MGGDNEELDGDFMHRNTSKHGIPDTTPPSALVGQARRFGAHGVLYEVIEIVSPNKARIRVIETGEETSYPIIKLRKDPQG